MKSIIFSAAYVALILATIAIPAAAIFSDVAADTEQALQTASDILLIIFSAASAAILAVTVLFRQKDGRRYLEAINGVNTDKSIDYFKKSIKYQFVPSVYFPAVAYYVSLSYKAGRHLDAFEFMNKHPKYYKYRALTYFYCLKALYEEDLFKAKELIFELEKGGKKYIKQITLIEKLQREDLKPIEAARAIKQLMEEYNFTQEAVADRIGKSRSNITNTLRLLTLYPEVVKMVEDGRLSAGHARALVVIEDTNQQIKLARQSADGKMSVRDLEKAVKNVLNPPKKVATKVSEQSLELKELIQDMQRVFATKVSAIGNDNKGRIYIDYYSRDDLDRLADMVELLKKKEITLADLRNYNKRAK